MNAEQIDEFFKACDESNIDKVLELAGVEKNGTPEDTIEKLGIQNLLKQIMQKIDGGDFEHFFARRETESSDSIFYDLIKHTSKVDRLKELISEKEEKFHTHEIVGLVKATKDPEYIKKYIEGHISKVPTRYIVDLIKATEDSEYMKKYIEGHISESPTKDIVDLVKATKDSEYIKKYIEGHISECPTEDIVDLIKETKDPEYIHTFIVDKEKAKSIGLDDSKRLAFIIELRDTEYIKSIIADKEKQEVLGLDNVDKILLIASTNDDRYIESEFEKPEYGIAELEAREDKTKEIKLPSDMTIGMEIESEGKSSEFIKKMTDTLAKAWKCKGDASLDHGVEVVSPILSGTNRRVTRSIKGVCQALEILEQKTSIRCGGHVHIGGDYLKSKESWQNLIEIVGNAEEILYTISNAKGEKPREGVGSYARPISGNIEKLAAGEKSFETPEDAKTFLKDAQGGDSHSNRYYGVNFLNLGHEKRTIEFRLSNGTVDENTWIENINLFGGIIKASEDLAQIQAKPEEQRSEAEKKKLSCLEKLKEEGISPEDKLEALLELTIPEEDRDVYRERYDVNHKLIEEDTKLKEEITGKTAKNPIKVNKNKVGKAVFTGEKAVTGQDYAKGVEVLKRDIEKGTFDRDSA